MSCIIKFAVLFCISNLLMGCDKETNVEHFQNNTVSSTAAPENNAQTNNSCSMWEQVSTDPNYNFTQNGTYCAKDGVTYKCKDAANSITVIGNCPSDMKTSRVLYGPRSDSVEQSSDPSDLKVTRSLWGGYLIQEQASDSTAESNSSEPWEASLDQQIKACKKWEPTPNSITKGGLYCNDQSGQMFRCLVNPNNGNDINQGGCPKMEAPPTLMI